MNRNRRNLLVFHGARETEKQPHPRKRGSSAVLCLLVLMTAVPLWSSSPLELQEVAPGVYTALQPFADRFNDSNSTVILLDDSVVVVDTQTTLTATRAVAEQIRHLTNKPVRWVINTHWHGDHVQGNQVYRELYPQVQFVAQVNTREDMAKRATAELGDDVASLPKRIESWRQMLNAGKTPTGKELSGSDKSALQMRIDTFSRELPDLQKTHILLPDLTFSDSLTIYGSSLEIRLVHYPGHTMGDTVVYLPLQKVLITGDLLDDMPYTGDGSPAELVKTLQQLDRLDFDIVIPGHGSIEQGHGHLHQIEALFAEIVKRVQTAVRSGLTLEETKKQVQVSEFRVTITNNEEHATRAFDGFVAAAIERAYQEAKGRREN